MKSGWLLRGVWYVLNADDVIMPWDKPAMPVVTGSNDTRVM
jgi:hypothetical protein